VIADPQAAHNGTFVINETPHGKIRLTKPAATFSATPCSGTKLPAPVRGASGGSNGLLLQELPDLPEGAKEATIAAIRAASTAAGNTAAAYSATRGSSCYGAA